MRKIPCPVSIERLTGLYQNLKLTDKQVSEFLNREFPEADITPKRCQNWRGQFKIETAQKWERHEVPPIEGQLKSILAGSMMGDGRLVFRRLSTHYEERHCAEQLPYLEWKKNIWGPQWAPSEIKPTGSEFRFGTVSHASLNDWQAMFYDNRERGWKRPTHEIVDHMDPLALAVWYLDDGSAGWWPTIIFGAVEESREVALSIFEKFGLQAEWYLFKDTPTTGRFSFKEEENALKFLDVIRPHVPECMSRKLLCGFQGHHYQVRQSLSLDVLKPLVEAGVPIKRIAAQLGQAPTTVSSFIDKLGLKHPRLRGNPLHREDVKRTRRTKKELLKVLDEDVLRHEAKVGTPIKRIAEQLDVGEATVHRALIKLGILHPRLKGSILLGN